MLFNANSSVHFHFLPLNLPVAILKESSLNITLLLSSDTNQGFTVLTSESVFSRFIEKTAVKNDHHIDDNSLASKRSRGMYGWNSAAD